jgi:3-oxoacyl-[acyl-carrier protein] reductase
MPIAIVTGAGGGLGRAIAVELASRGYLVHATDVDVDAAAETVAAIGAGARS